MSRPLRILFFGSQMAIGGAQKLLLDQARWFHTQGHEVTAVFFYDKQGLHGLWQTALPVPLMTMTVLGSRPGLAAKAWGLITGLVALWMLLRRAHFDVIETFTYDSNLLALPVAWLAGVPVRIATHHGIIEGFPAWIERLHALLINLGTASVLVSVSRKALDQAAKAGTRRDRMIVIPNGIALPPLDGTDVIDVRQELGVPADDLLVLSVGRLVYQKGHEFLIAAMPRVLERFPGAKAVICGDGILRSQLEAQVREKHLQASVFLMGNRTDIGRFLRSADVFALPSRWEGLPVALLEAMGIGLPVVATHVEGVEEVVQNGVQGSLVAPGDPGALAAALVELLGSPDLRTRMGQAARARVGEAYTLDTMCRQYLTLMRQQLGRYGT
jgi:glycosyltransferase involved in cell wall biosynthesis